MDDNTLDQEQQRFQAMLASAEADTAPPDKAFLERLKAHTTGTFLAADHLRREQRKKTIMKHVKRYAPLTAAACLIVGLIIVSYRTGTGPDLASNAYGELMRALDNSDATEWVHMQVHGDDGTVISETWASFKPFRALSVTQGQPVTFLDLGTERRYEYDSAANTIIITRFRTDDAAILNAGSLLGLLKQKLQEWQQQGLGTVTVEDEVVDGCDAAVYTWRSQTQRAQLVVDRQTERIVQFDLQAFGEGQSGKATFSYPATGPTDIYATGHVPRDAAVVDKTRETPAPSSLEPGPHL